MFVPAFTRLYSAKTHYESCHENLISLSIVQKKNYIQGTKLSAVSCNLRMYFSLKNNVQSILFICGLKFSL